MDAMCVATWERPAAFHLGALSFYFLAAGFPFFPPGARATRRHAMCSLTPVFTARWGRQSRISWGVKGRGGGILYLTLLTHTGVPSCGGGKAKKTGKENSRPGQRRRFISLLKSGDTQQQRRRRRQKNSCTQHQRQTRYINVIYSPYFSHNPLLSPARKICICLRSPSVFTGKHNLILE